MKRGRNQRRRPGGPNPNRALDSNGPDVRIRGTANQIYDKYLALARDASSAGDRVKAENYLQHAEHYFRLIRSMQPAQQPNQQAGNGADSDNDQPGYEDADSADQNETRQQKPRNEERKRKPAPEAADADADDTGSDGDDAPAEAAKPAKAAKEKDASDDEGEAERKPRHRRAPRRTAKADDDKAEAPAAAE